MPFNDWQVNDRNPLPEEICYSCSYVVPKILPVFEQPPVLLREILTSNSRQGRHLRKNIRQYNSAFAMASVRADFVSRGPKYNPTVSVHGRMYHEIAALEAGNGMIPRYASAYIHDTEHATSNRKHFIVVFEKICFLS